MDITANRNQLGSAVFWAMLGCSCSMLVNWRPGFGVPHLKGTWLRHTITMLFLPASGWSSTQVNTGQHKVKTIRHEDKKGLSSHWELPSLDLLTSFYIKATSNQYTSNTTTTWRCSMSTATIPFLESAKRARVLMGPLPHRCGVHSTARQVAWWVHCPVGLKLANLTGSRPERYLTTGYVNRSLHMFKLFNVRTKRYKHLLKTSEN